MARKRIVRKPQTSEIHPRFADVVETFAKNRNTIVRKMMSSYGLKANRKIFAMFGKSRSASNFPENGLTSSWMLVKASASILATGG